MLDEDSNVNSAADDLPRPPAGRRAARRPAGPPAPVAAAPAASAQPAVVVEKPTSAPEKPAFIPPVVPEKPAEAQAPLVGADSLDVGATPPKARRSSRRRTPAKSEAPAVESAPVGESAESSADALEKAVSSALANPFAAAPTTAEPSPHAQAALDELTRAVAESEGTTKPARRRTSRRRKTDADAAPEQSLIDASSAPDSVDAAPDASVTPTSQESGAPETPAEQERPTRTRTARARRSRRTAEPVEEAEELQMLPEAEDGPPMQDPAPGSDDTFEEALDDSDEDSTDDVSDDDMSGDDDDQPRRRRRRRGGRRRRRGRDGDDDAEDSADEQSDDDNADEESTSEDGGDTDSEAAGEDDANDSGARRKRRRRRRRGEDTSAEDEEGVEVVERVREPRRRRGTTSAPSSNSDEITGIDGSTRMEAKRQRRREGRQAGRRRTPVLSESEFLSRRESVDRQMVIRQADDYTQIAVIEDGVVVEHYVDRKSSTSLIGNVYLGRVQNVLPSMEAAFIDIGRGRNAVLYAGEVDWNHFGVEGDNRKVEQVFKSGQPVLVQVTKDPVGAKGARLTSHISIPGRYLVYAPGGDLSGISRKLPDTERQRLKNILDGLIDDGASVIVRTAAEGVSEEELVRDVNRLTAQWEAISKKAKQTGPALVYSEPDPTVRIVRDLFTEDFKKLTIAGSGEGEEDAYQTISSYVEHVAPHLAERIEKWDPKHGDLFSKYRVDEQLAKALERKVFLPSGGSLVIDRTEAMTVIDVNTGKFTGRGGNLEATVTSNNLEAAEEIVRQLRLRDIGGIIVVDFIDMVLPSNRELLLRRLVECLGRDRTRHQVSEVTSLGLVQMTRKKLGTGLHEAFTEPCEECKGLGYHRHDQPVETQAPSDGGERKTKRQRTSKTSTRTRGRSAHAESGSDEASSQTEEQASTEVAAEVTEQASTSDTVSNERESVTVDA